MKIKKGKLNYDQSGRAYPDNSEVKENWNCVWENDGKYYKLVGDNEHKEWDLVNIYNVIVDEVYENYKKEILRQRESQKKEVAKLRGEGKRLKVVLIKLLSKEEFVEKIKTDSEFASQWGIETEKRELSLEERIKLNDFNNESDILQQLPTNMGYIKKKLDENNIPTKEISLTYNDKTIEIYEQPR